MALFIAIICLVLTIVSIVFVGAMALAIMIAIIEVVSAILNA